MKADSHFPLLQIIEFLDLEYKIIHFICLIKKKICILCEQEIKHTKKRVRHIKKKLNRNPMN